MTVIAHQGPLIAYGQVPSSSIVPTSDNNPHRGPSLFDLGFGVPDQRIPFGYYPGGGTAYTRGWYATNDIQVLDVVPSSAVTTSVSSGTSVPVAGTALTFTSSSLALGMTTGVSITRSDTGATVTGLMAVGLNTSSSNGATGSSISYLAAGLQIVGGFTFWDPRTLLSRALTISVVNTTSSVGTPSSQSVTISGYDIYGYPMSEVVPVSSGSSITVTGKKAFKYISGATVALADASSGQYQIGISNTFGFPMYSGPGAVTYSSIFFGSSSGTLLNQLQSSSLSNVIAGLGSTLTATASSATGATNLDVRGTFGTSASILSDGVSRLVVLQSPRMYDVGTMVNQWPSGLVGVVQA